MSSRVSGYAKDLDLDSWDLAGDGTPEGATLMTPGNSTLGGASFRQDGHRLSSGDTNDWFCLDAECGATYAFSTLGATASIYASVYRADDFATPFKTEWRISRDSSSMTIAPSQVGRYYLRLRPTGTSTLTYAMVCRRTGGYDAWDRNGADNEPAGANELPAPSSEVRSVEGLSLCGYDTNDWFKVDLKAGRSYVFSMTGSTPASRIHCQLYAAGDFSVSLAEDDDAGTNLTATLRFTPITTGTYWLKVEQGWRMIVNHLRKLKSTFSYTFEYYEESTVDTNFVFTPAEYWQLEDDLPTYDWTANPFLTTNADEVTPLTAITTEDEGIVRWSFCSTPGRSTSRGQTPPTRTTSSAPRLRWWMASRRSAGSRTSTRTASRVPTRFGARRISKTRSG